MSDQPTSEELTDTAGRAWRWMLDQVRTDEVGPWIPEQVTGSAADETLPPYRDSMHSGIAGLAHVLAEIRLDRDWTDEESALAEAIGTRLRTRGAAELGYNFFGGLVSDIGAFVALGQQGAAAAVERLAALAEPDGWPQDQAVPPRVLPDARLSDATLGVASVAGSSPGEWWRRCLEAVRRSGIPARSHPGFWDNDGRCCGTAGVGSVLLDSYQRYGDPADLDFALTLATAVLEHAEGSANHAWWRFVEHRAADPVLPPGVGWMQGAAGIAAFLFQAARVVRAGPEAAAVLRMESWWAREGAA